LRLVSNLGERKIIKLFVKAFLKSPSDLAFFGDDVVAVDVGRGKVAVLKCDMLVSSTDIPPGMNLKQAGRKAVVSTVSDFAAKGVKPLVLLVSVGIPGGMKESELKLLISGLASGAKEYGTKIVGGDTNEAGELMVDCIGYGVAEKRNLIFRRGAKPGDFLASTGSFGSAPAGLKLLLENLKANKSLRRRLLKAVYEPKAHLKEGLALAKSGVATASIDSSDGLAWSLKELSEMSGVGFKVENLPISREALKLAEINRLNPVELALYGGEEFNIILTVKRKFWRKALKAVRAVGGNLYLLGEATRQRKLTLNLPGVRESKIKPVGWEHLKAEGT